MTSHDAEHTDDSAFVCEGYWQVRSACIGEPFYKEQGSKRYCILHFPGEEKDKGFMAAVQRKLEAKDFNFLGVWFPSAQMFQSFNFNTPADFGSATFNEGADFGRATFNEEADFGSATFNEGADFGGATFNSEANFSDATFSSEANFSQATFGDYVRFSGIDATVPLLHSSFDLQFASIEHPERVSFHSVNLRPHWFMNVDARKFEFTNVEWSRFSINNKDLAALANTVSSAHRLLSIGYRQLAVNAEENHRYEEASKFRYLSMDARRQEQWRGFPFWRLSWWYWVASGYGERVWQAAAVLILIILGFGLAYNKVGFERTQTKDPSSQAAAVDEVGRPLNKGDAIIYSLQVMTFQKPDPRPLTRAARCLVTLELVFGPVQAALFVLAVRRKFIR